MVGLTGQIKNHEREYLCKDVITEKYFTANASPLKEAKLIIFLFGKDILKKLMELVNVKPNMAINGKPKFGFKEKKLMCWGRFQTKVKQ